MRIGNQTIVRNYTTSLNTNLVRLNGLYNRVTSGRRFQSMYENTPLGVKTMQLRRSLEANSSYAEVAATVRSEFRSAETYMQQISDLGKSISERFTNALNDTNDMEERESIAQEIEAYRDQILASANGQFAGKYHFGGTNTTEPPFKMETTTDEYGNEDMILTYNGVDVSQMADENGELKPEYQYLLDDAAFVDMGLGMANDANGKLIENSAIKNTIVGLEFLGVGEDNMILKCNEMIKSLRGEAYALNPDGTVIENPPGTPVYEEMVADAPRFTALLDDMHAAYTNVALRETELGADYQYMEYTIARLDDEMLNIKERQNDVEWVDPAEAILDFNMQKYVYDAALAMGSKLLQPTLFNYIS
jgi:flagellin-like hook-associated protein FlgL